MKNSDKQFVERVSEWRKEPIKKVWTLVECDSECCFVHVICSSKRLALKSMLKIKRNMVIDNLNLRLLFGKEKSEICGYRHVLKYSKFYVNEVEVITK